MNKTQTTEIWFTTSKSGRRSAWRYSFAARRALPVKMADAEFAIATGSAAEVAKPGWCK